MSGFEVSEQAVQQARADLAAIAESIPQAQAYLNQHVYSAMEGGFFLSDAGDTINELRLTIYQQYAFGEDSVWGLLDAAVDALRETWRDYEASDAAARARSTELRVGVSQAGDELGLPGFGADGPWTQPVPPPAEPEPSTTAVSPAAYADALSAPTYDSSAHDAVDTFLEVKGKVDDTLGLKFLVDGLSRFGVPNPLEGFDDYMNGNLEEIGLAISAIDHLADYWGVVHGDLVSVSSQLGLRWRGAAAEATTAWIDELAGAVAEHQLALRATAGTAANEALLLKQSTAAVFDLAEDLADCVPAGDSLLDKILDIPDAAMKAAKLAWDRFNAFVTGFQSLTVIATAWVSLMSQATADVSFPPVSRPRVIPSR